MNVPLLRKAMLYAMMVAAFGTLHLSGETSPVVLGLFYSGALVSWFWDAPRIQFARWQTFWTALTLGVFAFTLVDIFVLREFFLISALNFVVFMATAKLFQRELNKDYIQAMALSLLLLAAGAVLNENLSYGILFAVYVVVATLGLTTQHLSVEVEQHPGAGSRSLRLERPILMTTLALSFVIFAGSAAFFFVFPRVGFGFFVQQSRRGVTTSGFGENVQLGAHGTIGTDNTIVLRAVFRGDPPMPIEGIHWRGLSLDFWDGRAWRDNDEERVEGLQRYEDTGGYLLDPTRRGNSWNDVVRGTVEVEVNLEPIESDVIFGIGRPIGLRLPGTISEAPDSLFGRNLTVDRTGEVSLSTRGSMGIRYIMWSEPNEPTAGRMQRAEWPDGATDMGAWIRGMATPEDLTLLEGEGSGIGAEIDGVIIDRVLAREGARLERDDRRAAQSYLQLPEGQITPRIAALANEVRATSQNPYDFAVAMESWLRSNISYTLDLPEPSGPDANLIDEFLFEWRRGHCEYFATTLVVLLRSQGIPARIVNGFLGGDYNDVGDFYAIRQSMAHSWVEVYFPEVGWVEFDPTPAGALAAERRGGFASRMAMWLDNMRLMWFRWVVEYDLEKQASVFRDAFERMTGDDRASQDRTLGDLRSALLAVLRSFRAIGALILLGVIFGLTYRARAKRRIRWDNVDWALGAAWLTLALWAVSRWWSGGMSLPGALFAVVPPLVGIALAFALRKALFDDPDEKRVRPRAELEVSRLHLALLRDVEKAGEPIDVSTTPAELVTLLGVTDPALAAELVAWVDFYVGVRFAGRPDDAALRQWRPRHRRLRRELCRWLVARRREQVRAAAQFGTHAG